MIVPGTEMVIDVDPDGTLDPSLGIGGRIPAEGRLALDVRAVPPFNVTAEPFLWQEKPDSSGFKVVQELTAEHELFYETREWLPVAEMNVAVREAVFVDYDPTEHMDRVLTDLAMLYAADGASGYYMGVPPWMDGGVVGIAFIDSRVSVSRLDGHTIAHEFGHNLSLSGRDRLAPAGRAGHPARTRARVSGGFLDVAAHHQRALRTAGGRGPRARSPVVDRLLAGVAGDASQPATTLVFDQNTRRIVAILRDSPGGQVAADGVGLGFPSITTPVSSGIPNPVDRRR